ncbi:sigma 54-interacting transcriptional regulator, partial [bacterium]|nr:sigma 54-interacting transcriptional regulator [bacterium]
MNAYQHLRAPLESFWRALLNEKAATQALSLEQTEQLASLFGDLIQRAGETHETLSIAEPTEPEHLLFQLWPQGLPHLADLRDLARTQGTPVSLRDVENVAIGQTQIFTEALKLAVRIASTDVPVTLLGETGVGKELLATVIHAASRRCSGPFLAVNCGALPESLYAAELFGYEPGSFTGADRQGRLGKIEAASGGTLFLDEISELVPPAQAALLRFLDNGEIQKIGKAKPTKIDVRIICASGQNLEELVEKGVFRQDLFYRLGLFPIAIPPLRQRKQDIPLLVEHFCDHAVRKHDLPKAVRVSSEAMQLLMGLEWPGNVRQLAFAIERAILVAKNEELQTSDFKFLQTPPKNAPRAETTEMNHLLRQSAIVPAN